MFKFVAINYLLMYLVMTDCFLLGSVYRCRQCCWFLCADHDKYCHWFNACHDRESMLSDCYTSMPCNAVMVLQDDGQYEITNAGRSLLMRNIVNKRVFLKELKYKKQ